MNNRGQPIQISWRNAFVVVMLLGLLAGTMGISNVEAQDTYTETPTLEEQEIQASVQSALNNSSHLYVMIFDVKIEKITYQDNWAVIILQLYEKDTQSLVATEPGIAIAWKDEAGWITALPGDGEWYVRIPFVPESLLTQEMKNFLLVGAIQPKDDQVEAQAYSGYYLPWPKGVTHRLTRSISHTSSPEAYAFDFADTNNPLFEVSAARGGEVWYAVWTYPNGYWDGDSNHANYVVVKSGSLYDVYLHLAQNSVPSHLRTRGNTVLRGEKIGNADDTGNSSGHHLHFQVHTNPNSWYGQSVDIVFEDVSVCGGRPRLPGEDSCASTQYYTSGNPGSDSIPPTTSISPSGTAGENSWYRSTVQVALSAVDNSGGSGVSQTQYRIDAGSWLNYSSPFTISADGVHTLYYKSVDVKGNWESEKSTTIKIDSIAPAGSFSIQNGSAQTYSVSVSLDTQATDAGSGVASIHFRDFGQSTWSAWQSSPGSSYWVLPGPTGQTFVVEAQFKDHAGNLSTIYSDSVTLNLYPARPSSELYSLQHSTFGMSGMRAASPQYLLNGTAGQPTIIGSIQSTNYQLHSGYWAIVTTIPDSYELDVTKTGTGNGMVSSDPIGISCGTDCSESYNSGIVVVLTATPAEGSAFTGWSGAVSGSTNPLSITMDGDKAVTANFEPVPIVVLSTRLNSNPSNRSTVFFLVTFSESVTGVNAADFALATSGDITGASIASVSGSGATRTVSVNTGTGDGTLRLDVVDDDSIQDAALLPLGGAGAGNGDFPGPLYTIDRTAPRVVSIRRDSATRASANPTSARIVSFTVTFSEPVYKVDAADFRLAMRGVTGAQVSSVSGSKTTWTVMVRTGMGSGILGLNLVDNNSIVDYASNYLGGPALGDGNFTGQSYTIIR